VQRIVRRIPAEKENRFWALRDVSLKIPKGQIVGLIGRNGAGKSTLLKILSRITAVTEGVADVAPVDAYALQLLRQFRPELTRQVRVVARTDMRPIPLLVASAPRSDTLAAAFLTAHADTALAPIMADLLLDRFVQPDPSAYDGLAVEYEAMLAFWRDHRLAGRIHPELVP